MASPSTATTPHSSPCSPSRASLYTGSYLAQHGVVDNVSFPAHTALDPAIPTIGSLLVDQGYYSAYLGKWHLSHEHIPVMTDYGYQDFRGNDMHYTGSAWSGRFFDPIIAADAINWLKDHAHDDEPWHLTVALVNPHDIMWFPIDHPTYQPTTPPMPRSSSSCATSVSKAFRWRAMSGGLRRTFRHVAGELPTTTSTPSPRFNVRGDKFETMNTSWARWTSPMNGPGCASSTTTPISTRSLTRISVSYSTPSNELGVYDDTVIAYTSDHGDAVAVTGSARSCPASMKR